MRRVYLIVVLLLCVGTVQARVKQLPADSIALPAQFLSGQSAELHLDKLVSYDKKHVWLSCFTDCFARIPLKKGLTPTLDCIENPVYGCLLRVRIGGLRRDSQFTIALKVPDSYRVCVNGREEHFPVKDGYTLIKYLWRNNYEILIQHK